MEGDAHRVATAAHMHDETLPSEGGVRGLRVDDSPLKGLTAALAETREEAVGWCLFLHPAAGQ